MGPFGAIIVSFWAVVWFEAGIARQLGWLSPLLALPLLVSGAIVAWAAQVILQPGTSYALDRHSRTIIMQATIGEGVGIAIFTNVLINTDLTDYVLPSVALVVGLHFIYMAYYIPRRRFYYLAMILLIGSAAGLALGPREGDVLIGVGTAIVFWVFAVLAIRQSASSAVCRIG